MGGGGGGEQRREGCGVGAVAAAASRSLEELATDNTGQTSLLCLLPRVGAADPPAPRLSTVEPTVGRGSAPPSQPPPRPHQDTPYALTTAVAPPRAPERCGNGGSGTPAAPREAQRGPVFPGGLGGGRFWGDPNPQGALQAWEGAQIPPRDPDSGVGTSPRRGADPPGLIPGTAPILEGPQGWPRSQGCPQTRDGEQIPGGG